MTTYGSKLRQMIIRLNNIDALTKDGEPVDQKVYRSMIGLLLYLCASRPDIMLSVCMCARYQAAPK